MCRTRHCNGMPVNLCSWSKKPKTNRNRRTENHLSAHGMLQYCCRDELQGNAYAMAFTLPLAQASGLLTCPRTSTAVLKSKQGFREDWQCATAGNTIRKSSRSGESCKHVHAGTIQSRALAWQSDVQWIGSLCAMCPCMPLRNIIARCDKRKVKSCAAQSV